MMKNIGNNEEFFEENIYKQIQLQGVTTCKLTAALISSEKSSEQKEDCRSFAVLPLHDKIKALSYSTNGSRSIISFLEEFPPCETINMMKLLIEDGISEKELINLFKKNNQSMTFKFLANLPETEIIANQLRKLFNNESFFSFICMMWFGVFTTRAPYLLQ